MWLTLKQLWNKLVVKLFNWTIGFCDKQCVDDVNSLNKKKIKEYTLIKTESEKKNQIFPQVFYIILRPNKYSLEVINWINFVDVDIKSTYATNNYYFKISYDYVQYGCYVLIIEYLWIVPVYIVKQQQSEDIVTT